MPTITHTYTTSRPNPVSRTVRLVPIALGAARAVMAATSTSTTATASTARCAHAPASTASADLT